ncbi:MAG: hypothetical protein IAF58_10495 [Leptolyngbya sp.]|nr:hypothetical protein [Candidatus Melainabacteria bacterium]
MSQRRHYRALQTCASFALIVACGFGSPGASAQESAKPSNIESQTSVDAVSATDAKPEFENPVRSEQVERDRQIVQFTFIAAAVLMCSIAFLMLVSIPKAAKKTE